MRKYVVSKTLRSPEWLNTTVVEGDPVAEIRRLKSEAGGDIVQYGFGQLSFALIDNGLLDQLRPWVHPFFVGRGGPEDLLYRATMPTTFELADATTLRSGIAILSYRYVGAVSGEDSEATA